MGIPPSSPGREQSVMTAHGVVHRAEEKTGYAENALGQFLHQCLRKLMQEYSHEDIESHQGYFTLEL